MQTCTNCGHKNNDNLHFCVKCTVPLDPNPEEITIPTVKPSFRQQLRDKVKGTTGLLPVQNVVLHIEGAAEPVPLTGGRQTILGRESADDLEPPDLDLTAYGAREKGVSRAHAAIYRRKDKVTIVDMGSANGTYLNGQQLKAGHPYLVRNRDEIHLGQLAIEARFE